jgi:hypothetical protein
MLKNNNQIKGIKECTTKHFAFYYNSTCIIYKDTKYGTGWWPEELILNYVSTT